MASTNKTTNYELSQFLGTDKPAWLSDYNTDMSKIDTQMKANADAASGADGKADANTTAIGTLANLTTDAKTTVVAAINEVDSHADAAQGTASSALSTATSASTAANGLSTYLNINNFTEYNASNFTVITGTGTIRNNSTITVAKNADGSLGKIYGHIVVDNPSGTATKVRLNVDTGFRPSSKITINYSSFVENIPTSLGLSQGSIDINVDGTIDFSATSTNVNITNKIIRCIACLLFIKNFGDQPED